MANHHATSPDAEDPLDSGSEGVPPQMTVHPTVGYSGMPMHMYPYANNLHPGHQTQLRSKRRQVKNACTNCQKACKKCDDARPCLRCVKYGIAEECVDSQRKERKKGVKRGPYKKRDGKDPERNEHSPEDDAPEAPRALTIPTAATSASPPMAFMPMAYPPGFFGQYPGMRPGEGQPAYYPQFFIMPPPPPTADGEQPAYPPHPQFYPAFLPYAQYPQFMMPRPDGQMPPGMPPGMHMPYPMYQPPKPPSAGASSEPGAGAKEPQEAELPGEGDDDDEEEEDELTADQ